MKKINLTITLLVLFVSLSFAQHKPENHTFTQRLTQPAPQSLIEFLNPEKISFSHSLSSSFATSGGGSALTNLFMTTLNYKFTEKFHGNFTLGIANQPYNSFQKDFSNSEKNDFVGGIEFGYKPNKNTYFSFSASRGLIPSSNTRFSTFGD